MTIPPSPQDVASAPAGARPPRARVLLGPPPATGGSPAPVPVESSAPPAAPHEPATPAPTALPAAQPAAGDPLRGAWLGGAALALALVGEGLLFDEARRAWGALTLLAAMALGVLAWGATPDR